MLVVSEIFKSIQGESSRTGLLCSFVRLAGCNLRCRYCDTAYAWEGGTQRTIESAVAEVRALNATLVEITGGEPLLQADTPLLCSHLIDAGHTVLVETNGTIDIAVLPDRVVRIVDVKTPSSGHAGSFYEKNFGLLRQSDECKFVISDKNDFDWSLDIVHRQTLDSRCANVIFSPDTNALPPKLLAEWIVADNAPVRLGLQLHKIIWGDKRGV